MPMHHLSLLANLRSLAELDAVHSIFLCATQGLEKACFSNFIDLVQRVLVRQSSTR